MLQDYAAPPTTSAWFAANDNEVGSTQVDRIVEIRPSPAEQMRIVVNDAIRIRGGYGPITHRELDAAARRNLKVEDGRIVKWRGSDNRWHHAAELFRQVKGGRRKTDEERLADNQRHLSISGSGGFPVASTYRERGSEGEDYRRMRSAHWAQSLCACNDNRRMEIDRTGLGSRATFAEARSNAGLAPAERCPTAIAHGAEFLAYRVHSNPTAAKGSFVGAPDAAENAIVAGIDAPRIAAALGEHREVLEASLDGMTAREIAAKRGWGSGKAGERKSVALQDAALVTLEKIAA
ncbi:hypothetical protein [Bradyrhizobium genosp. SA-3]|uniref:hypothetical protein n=1 Tax=Bradyrhizobium genosp. SA-3 TaxID=508868 RepID=UPI001FDFE3CD|nr:hypothetical protein [Bradyrhizobium genosp. SA-3]